MNCFVLKMVNSDISSGQLLHAVIHCGSIQIGQITKQQFGEGVLSIHLKFQVQLMVMGGVAKRDKCLRYVGSQDHQLQMLS